MRDLQSDRSLRLRPQCDVAPSMIDYDSELQHHHGRLMSAIDVRTNDRVLDIGCGTGQTTRDIERIATGGSVIGVDISDSAVRRAYELSSKVAQRSHYIRSDASQLPFSASSFSLAISRFGTMFFDNPVAAFTNIRRTLRPSTKLIMMVWQSAEQNEWAMEIERALIGRRQELPAGVGGASAFSLGDTHLTQRMLHAAGFENVHFEDVREPVFYGGDVESAFNFVSVFSRVTQVVESQTNTERDQTLVRIREMLAGHLRTDGVMFDAASWIVSAHVGV